MSEIPKFLAEDGTELDGFDELFEHAFPASYQRGMLRARAYEGQPHTDHGHRGRQEIHGITFRDLHDAFVRACCLSAGGISEEYDRFYQEATKGERALLAESDVYDLPWERMDIIAVAQNLSCEIERLMGIFPNLDGGG